jgi:murein DD-endopeptidase MepM/ murein hydrolase activator NlpD
MAENKYYYFDEESCSFVEVRSRRFGWGIQGFAVLAVAVVLTIGVSWGIGEYRLSPQELALRSENQSLLQQLSSVSQQVALLSERLDELSEADRELYRTLLEAEPISEDVRQMGVGGSDTYATFDRFSGNTARLLRQTSQALDQIERRIALQNASYRQLSEMAGERSEWMAQLPAILPADGPVVSGFGVRRHPILRVQRMHHGIDVVMPIGTPVFATGDGFVSDAGYDRGYGRFIEITHPLTGYVSFYAHLSEVSRTVRVGSKVERGQQIALSGNTGQSTGPHLHYEVRDTEGRSLNPLLFVAPSMKASEYRELVEQAESSITSLD